MRFPCTKGRDDHPVFRVGECPNCFDFGREAAGALIASLLHGSSHRTSTLDWERVDLRIALAEARNQMTAIRYQVSALKECNDRQSIEIDSLRSFSDVEEINRLRSQVFKLTSVINRAKLDLETT